MSVNPSAALRPAKTSTMPQTSSSAETTRLAAGIGFKDAMIRRNRRETKLNRQVLVSPVIPLCYGVGSVPAHSLMSTCPRCKGHLNDNHRCPRRPMLVALEIIAAAFVGGFAGLLLVAIFDPHGQITDVDTISVIGGALIAVGINRALRR
jgi:hypothetical protein